LRQDEPGSAQRSIIGIDPSLRGLGIVALTNGEVTSWHGTTDVKKLAMANDCLHLLKMPGATVGNKLQRAVQLADVLVRAAKLRPYHGGSPGYVAIEGYAFGASSRGESDMHESAGLIKVRLFEAGWKLRIYTPSTLKLAWTGNGGADKAEMRLAAYRLFGHSFDELGKAAENIVDALLLAKLLRLELVLRAEGTPSGNAACGSAVEALTKRARKKGALSYVEQPFAHREDTDVKFAW